MSFITNSPQSSHFSYGKYCPHPILLAIPLTMSYSGFASPSGAWKVAGVRGVGAIGVVAGALEDRGHRGFGAREFARKPGDGFGFDPTDLFRPFGRVAVARQMVAEAVESFAVALDEVAVV